MGRNLTSVFSIIHMKTFQVSLSNFGQKSFAPPKVCLSLHLVVSRPIFASLSLKGSGLVSASKDTCQAKFLTTRPVRMHRVIFYISNTLRKVMIRA